MDELLGAHDDGLAARLQELARVVALALLILAGLDVLTRGLCKHDLQVGVHVDLGDAHADGLLHHLGRDAGAAVENERQIANERLDFGQAVERQASPVIRIQAVDVADAASQEVDAGVGDGLALLRVSKLAQAGNAVFDAADAADLSLDRDALRMGDLHDLGRALEVEIEGLESDIYPEIQNMTKDIQRALKDEILLTPRVKLVKKGSLPQSEGKAVRVHDLRNNK